MSLIAQALKKATPGQLIKVRYAIERYAMRYDGILIYNNLIAEALVALEKGNLASPELIQVLDRLVPTNKLAEALS